MTRLTLLFLWLCLAATPLSGITQSTRKTTPANDSLVYIDAKTGLMWMRQDFSYREKRFMEHWDETRTWQQQMNKEKYAGYSDWRVPTIAEYRSINRNSKDREKYRQEFKELDTVCVWGNGPYSFWSSNEKSKYVASYISFIDGFATSGDKSKQWASGDWEGIYFGFSVRLVRKVKAF